MPIGSPIKHALVVDDSASARQALKGLLEQHGMAVELAETGEAALELLEHTIVDVVFMDHTMPGMDGLEAVSAIKANPRTATIPVMMYTTKEGEVYVGQARALGAIGVLPKQVQPGVLFDMLLKLGLVSERRGAANDDGHERTRPETGTRAGDTPAEPSLGMSATVLIRRMLEDQHAALRSDILGRQRDVARSVAVEVLEERNATAAPLPQTPVEWLPSRNRLIVAGGVAFAAVALLLLALNWQTTRQIHATLDDSSRDLAAERERTEAGNAGLQSTLDAQREQARGRYLRSIVALQWALNENARVPYGGVAFDDARATQLRDLLSHLIAIHFRGTVRLEAHLGAFCLDDATGELRPAAPDTPVEACTLIGHPLDNSASEGDQQTVAFADFLTSSPFANQAGINVEVIAHDRSGSVERLPFPPSTSRAGDWNRIAAANNRVEFTLLAAEVDQRARTADRPGP